MRTLAFMIVLAILLPIACIKIASGTEIYSNTTSLSDEYYSDTARIAKQALLNEQTEVEPVDYLNGDVYMVVPIAPGTSTYNNRLMPVESKIQIDFSEKNITGYEFIKSTTLFNPTETGIWWSSSLKVPISATETLVKDFLLYTQGDRIREFPDFNETQYISSGTLTIGDSEWPVQAAYIKTNDNSTGELLLGSYCKYCEAPHPQPQNNNKTEEADPHSVV